MCKQDVQKNVIKWGSIITLGGLGGTLVAGAILALFGNSFNNTLVLTPLVEAVDRLSLVVSRLDKSVDMRLEKTAHKNTKEHNIIVGDLKVINKRINVNEVKLFRVVSDCNENHHDIKTCQREHKGK